jgi:hypothetical protein
MAFDPVRMGGGLINAVDIFLNPVRAATGRTKKSIALQNTSPVSG